MKAHTTVKVWISKEDFAALQDGSTPKQFYTTNPREDTKFVEMVVGFDTLNEWASKSSSKSSAKTMLYD